MAEYKLTNKAIEDLGEIWDYTSENWSENQADNYYEMLISAFQKIAENPSLGKTYLGIAQNLLGLKVNRHIIFYRNTSKGYTEITRILHQRMELRKRITE